MAASLPQPAGTGTRARMLGISKQQHSAMPSDMTHMAGAVSRCSAAARHAFRLTPHLPLVLTENCAAVCVPALCVCLCFFPDHRDICTDRAGPRHLCEGPGDDSHV